jgi:hypothetical protein
VLFCAAAHELRIELLSFAAAMLCTQACSKHLLDALLYRQLLKALR